MVFAAPRWRRFAAATAALAPTLLAISCAPTHGFGFWCRGRAAVSHGVSRGSKASAVAPTKSFVSRTGRFQRSSSNPLVTLAASSDPDEPARSKSARDVFVLSYDGAVADTAETNALLAIDAALSIWPELIGLYIGFGDNSGIDEFETPDEGPEEGSDAADQGQCEVGGGDWLRNKMVALSPAAGGDPDALVGCDAVLLARMLLEEQRLDSGRSVGSGGKYGSKFHPSSSPPPASSAGNSEGAAAKETSRDWRGNANGSRPLTVGEIRANWSTGALLRETVRARFNVDGRDPIPVIREEIEQLRREESVYPTPTLHKSVADILKDQSLSDGEGGVRTVVVCVGHASHVPSALESLSQLNVAVRVVESTEDEAMLKDGGVVIVPPRRNAESPGEIMQRIIEHAASERTEDGKVDQVEGEPTSIYLIHSSPDVLRDCKRRLLGDDPPRFIDGYLRTPLKHGRVQLSLLLPSWAENVDKQHRNDAEMDPWLGVLGADDAKSLMTRPGTEVEVIEAAPFS